MTKRYVPDMNLLTTWDAAEKFTKYPLMAIFEFDGKHLIYIGTLHNSITRSPETFDAINYAFSKFDIDCVITEFEHHWKSIEERPFTNLGKNDMNELAYAPYIARKKNIPFVFADTNDADWIKDFDKISHDHAIRLQTMWILNEAKKYKETFHKNDTIAHAFGVYKHKLSEQKHTLSLTLREFKQCCEKDFGVVVSDENVSDVLNNFKNWNYPNMDGNVPNQIWAQIGLYSRNPNMINEIFKAINKHTNVLATMGAGHFEEQRLVLEKSFGEPEYIFKFPSSERIDISDKTALLQSQHEK